MNDSNEFTPMSKTFILRIWRENHDGPGNLPILRGQIEDVETGETRYIKEKIEILEFLALHLKGIGLKFD